MSVISKLKALVARKPVKPVPTGLTTGPFDLTLNTTLDVGDPNATSNNPSTAVQLQNASPFTLSALFGGETFTIQPFTAQTITGPSNGGQSLHVTPMATTPTATATNTFKGALTTVWLMAGQTSPMADGALQLSSQYSQIQLFSGSVTGVGVHTFSQDVTVSPFWRSLWVATPEGFRSVTPIGDQTGFVYTPIFVPNMGGLQMYRIYPLVSDTSITITMQISGTGTWFLGADLDTTEVGVYPASSDGTLPVTVKATTLPSTPIYGQITVSATGTAKNLTHGVLTQGVIVRALDANSAVVAIGDSSVTTSNGYTLDPGEAVSAALVNVGDLYVNGTAGDGVCWLGS